MRNLRVAISFLTRVHIPNRRTSGERHIDMPAAVPWFPFVGGLVGATVGGAMAGLVHLVPALVAACVAVLFGVALTGAFHEDGLADVADAFAGGWNPADRLRILKDPLHGSYGVAALCGSMVLRIVCVGVLGTSPAVAFAAVIAAHALGRTGAVLLTATLPAARPDGLGADASRSWRSMGTLAGLASGVVITAAATGWWAAPFLLAAVVGAGIVGSLSMKKIGGVTGDVLGAAEQVIECLVLVVATGLAARYTVWWV